VNNATHLPSGLARTAQANDQDADRGCESAPPDLVPRPVVACKGVWKIYGQREREALAAGQTRGLNKAEIMGQYGCVVAVADATFSVFEGEIFCVMGLSGSGKSSLLRHLNRLIEPTAGEILIDGQDITRMTDAELRRLRVEKVSMVFQSGSLFPIGPCGTTSATALRSAKYRRRSAMK
jgi:ABC-type proline/glycine betaine transport system ATPase subunit